MDPDLVLEVPDTPDRLARSVDGSCGPSVGKVIVDVEVNSPSFRRTEHFRHSFARQQRDPGLHNGGSSSTAPVDTEHLFRQARLARLLSETLESKSPLQNHSKLLELEHDGVSNEGGKSVETIDLSQNSPFPLPFPTKCRDSRRRNGKDFCREREGSGADRSLGRTELLGVGTSLPTTSVGRPRSRTRISFKPASSVSEGEKAVASDEANMELKHTDKGKGIELCNDSQVEFRHALSSPLQLNAPQRHVGQRKLVRNGCISPCNIAKSNAPSEVVRRNNMNYVDGGTYFAATRDQDKREEIDLSGDSQSRTRQRKVVWNGCISPINITEGRTAGKAKQDGVDNMASSGLSNGVAHQSRNVNSLPNKKGKAIVDDYVETNGKHGRAKYRSSRKCSRNWADVTSVANTDSDGIRPEDTRWKISYNNAEKASTLLFRTDNDYKREDASSHPSDKSRMAEDRSHINVVGESPQVIALVGSSPRAVRPSTNPGLDSRMRSPMKGKRKYTSTCYQHGESSFFDEPEVSYLGSSWQSSSSKATRTGSSRQRGIRLGPVIEVDELHSPEVAFSDPQEQGCRVSDDSVARAMQVESDELFARQLQERFYTETPVIENPEEIDANIAWSLQQEDDARRASLISRRNQYAPRDTSAAQSRSRLHFRNSSSSSTNRNRHPTSARMAQLTREFNRHRMEIEMGLNFFEDTEAAFNNGSRFAVSAIHRVERDFNENDYEMLLALDENNHQHAGASENLINSLPESVIQTDDVEEPCAVCIEKPSIGDIIRHLPCLHKFHKDCIDPWLRRKTSCPVCKFDIS